MGSLVNIFSDSISYLFFTTSVLEWFGVFTGILCVWLAAKNNILNWPIAIVSVLIYIILFYDAKLYADMGLQVYFFGMNIYGWYYWAKNKSEGNAPVARIKKKEIILAIIGVVTFTAIIGYILHSQTDAAFPFVDSFCTACSFIAQIFLARKVIENWLIWIFVDLIYVGVYFIKELYATGLMYGLYIYIAAMGYLAWKKIYHEQTN